MHTQRFIIAVATDGDVSAAEIGSILDACGYHGVAVIDQADIPGHECPCPSVGCIDHQRKAGHVIDEAVACCICWTRAEA